MEKIENAKNMSKGQRLLTLWVNIASFIFFLGVCCNFMEIIIRLMFSASIDLLFDLPVWFTVWSMLMVSGVVLLEDGHVSIDFFREKLSGIPRRILEICNALLTLTFGLIITWGGIDFVLHLYKMDATFTRSISVPKWIVESCVPFGMALFSLCALYKLIKLVRLKWE